MLIAHEERIEYDKVRNDEKKSSQEEENDGDTEDRCSRGWTLSTVSSFMICKHYHIYTKRQWLECKMNCDAMRCCSVTWWYSKSFRYCYPCDRLLMLWIWKLQFKEEEKFWNRQTQWILGWLIIFIHKERIPSLAQYFRNHLNSENDKIQFIART